MASQTPTHGIRLTHLERELLIAKHAGAKCNEAQEMWLGLEICLRYSFPEGSAVKENPPANAGDAGSIPESGRSPGEGYGNPLQYSCLGSPLDRGATAHGITKSLMRLSN